MRCGRKVLQQSPCSLISISRIYREIQIYLVYVAIYVLQLVQPASCLLTSNQLVLWIHFQEISVELKEIKSCPPKIPFLVPISYPKEFKVPVVSPFDSYHGPPVFCAPRQVHVGFLWPCFLVSRAHLQYLSFISASLTVFLQLSVVLCVDSPFLVLLPVHYFTIQFYYLVHACLLL